ncbi:MAG TPA: hypothetical protein VIM42_02565 [Clostridium sp.]
MFETRTFTFKEMALPKNIWDSIEEIRYCSYCGNKAILESSYDSDSRYEELTYYCDCEDAQHEQVLKEELANVNNRRFNLEQQIIKLEDLDDNETVNNMKYQKELISIKKKYNIK